MKLLNIMKNNKKNTFIGLSLLGIYGLGCYVMGRCNGFDDGFESGMDYERNSYEDAEEFKDGPILECGIYECDCPIMTKQLMGCETEKDFEKKPDNEM